MQFLKASIFGLSGINCWFFEGLFSISEYAKQAAHGRRLGER